MHSHFGGGPKAIPPAPVGPRGSGQLVLFGGLGVACLIVSLIAAGRLLLYRRRVTAAQAAPPPGPSYPGATPPALAYPRTGASQVQRSQVQAGRAQTGLRRPIRPPSRQRRPATSWWSQDNGTRPPGPAAAPDRGEPNRTVAGPQPPRTEPHPVPSPPLPAQPPADPASTWWSQGNGTWPPGPAPRRAGSAGPDRPGRPGPAAPVPCPRPAAADPASTWWSQGNGTGRRARRRRLAGPAGPCRGRPAAARAETPGEPHPSPSLPPPAPPSDVARPVAARRSASVTGWPAAAARPVRRRHGRARSGRGQPERDDPGLADLGRHRRGPPAQVPWPGNDDVREHLAVRHPAGPGRAAAGSPPAGPLLRRDAVSLAAAAGSPPFAPAPVRPGSAPAGTAGPSRYLQGLGRPSPSGRHATRRDHPQPAPAWARNRPPGSQDNDGAEPDPQDEP